MVPQRKTEACVSRVLPRALRAWAGAAHEDGMEWPPGGLLSVRTCASWVTLVTQAEGREVAAAWPVVLVAGMLFWNFPVRKQPSSPGWPQSTHLPCVGPQGRHFTGHRSPRKGSGKQTTWAPQQPSSRCPSQRPLPQAVCSQGLASLTLTPLRWVPPSLPGSEYFGVGWGHVLDAASVRALCSVSCPPAQVHYSNLPPALALPSGVPPYAPVSQPAVQFMLQGSLPPAGCRVAQSPAPVPTILTTASEPAGHAANNAEENTAAPRPALDKAKNEEVSPPTFPQRGRASG